MSTTFTSTDSDVVRAILDDELARWARDVTASSDAASHAQHVADVCARIRAETVHERDRLLDVFHGSGVTTRSTKVSDQRHSLHVEVLPDDAPRAVEAAQAAGFERQQTWKRGARRSFWRFADGTILTRQSARAEDDGSRTIVLRLWWRRAAPSRLRRLLVPTPADWALVELPGPLWWLYSALRPVRLAAERAGLRSRDHGDLEPYLVTPSTLIDPLLDIAGCTDEDVVADIGCGDGRIVIAAALRGARAIGIEQSAESVAEARRQVGAAEVGERVEIVHGDAAAVPLTDVTLAVLFVPMVVACRLVPDLLTRLAPGARIVLHEQSALPSALPRPSASHAIIGGDALTVAHVWNVLPAD